MARGDVVLTVDDDGQNPPEAGMRVLKNSRASGLDAVYGRFEIVEQSGGRRLASAFNRWLSRRTMNNSRDIAITNVRAIRGDLARAIGRVDSPFPYIDALVFRMTRNIGEVPVPHRKRGTGASNYTLGKLISLWLSHMTSLTVLPLRFAMIGSFGVSIAGFVIGAIELVSGACPEGSARWMAVPVRRRDLPVQRPVRVSGDHQRVPGENVRCPE